jgi:hypothetical protein
MREVWTPPASAGDHARLAEQHLGLGSEPGSPASSACGSLRQHVGPASSPRKSACPQRSSSRGARRRLRPGGQCLAVERTAAVQAERPRARSPASASVPRASAQPRTPGRPGELGALGSGGRSGRRIPARSPARPRATGGEPVRRPRYEGSASKMSRTRMCRKTNASRRYRRPAFPAYELLALQPEPPDLFAGRPLTAVTDPATLPTTAAPCERLLLRRQRVEARRDSRTVSGSGPARRTAREHADVLLGVGGLPPWAEEPAAAVLTVFREEAASSCSVSASEAARADGQCAAFRRRSPRRLKPADA